jgi:hypothetical protein
MTDDEIAALRAEITAGLKEHAAAAAVLTEKVQRLQAAVRDRDRQPAEVLRLRP